MKECDSENRAIRLPVVHPSGKKKEKEREKEIQLCVNGFYRCQRRIL